MFVIGADTHKSTHTPAAVDAATGRVERGLVGDGERVVRVAPKPMGQSRRGERRPGASDDFDAVAVARARSLDSGVWQDRSARRLAAMPQSARVRVARDERRRIREPLRPLRPAGPE